MKKLYVLACVLIAATILLVACGPSAPAQPTDLLSQIKQRGYLLVSTDPNYEPQSFLNTAGKRPSDTKCPSDTLTSAEMQGFDVDTAVEIGKRLGVETCFATPDWDVITAGNWADKWDISVGSMTDTVGREKVLYFTPAYYYGPAVVAMAKDAPYKSIADLAGQPICAATSTDYEAWAMNDPTMPASVPPSSWLVKPPAGMKVTSVTTDQECPQSIQSGRKDFLAYTTAKTVVDSNISDGLGVVQLGDPIFYEPLAVAIDKAHKLDSTSLRTELANIVKAMHADGTLSAASMKWFKSDLTKIPGQ